MGSIYSLDHTGHLHYYTMKLLSMLLLVASAAAFSIERVEVAAEEEADLDDYWYDDYYDQYEDYEEEQEDDLDEVDEEEDEEEDEEDELEPEVDEEEEEE